MRMRQNLNEVVYTITTYNNHNLGSFGNKMLSYFWRCLLKQEIYN
jgi:hypothetical protein